MSDIPADPWAALLVGHQWPGATALAVLSGAATSRHTVGTSFHGYADTMRSVADAVLSDQDGHAAEVIRASFRSGEDHARGVAERNAAKNAALTRAHHSASELRSALAEIAEHGSGRIRSILESTQPAPAKIAAIVEVAQAAQADADTRAAVCMDNLYGSIQHVLDRSGHETSARQFAHDHGFTGSTHHAPHPHVLHQQVQQIFEKYYGTDQPTIIAASTPIRNVDDAATPASDTPIVAPIHAGRTAVPVTPVSAIPGTQSRPAPQPAVRPLPAYGGDVRPTAVAPPAAPASAPHTTAPISGPTTASAIVTRRAAPAAERARPAPEPASDVVALLHAVARQEPMLRWAIGVLPSGPMLATEFSGWVPPHIDVPAGLGLLEPCVRDGDLTDWFGADATTLTHEPGGPLPAAGDPVPMRDRAGPQVDDLGWKIMQATRCREGLPRLSHTAAKAAVTGLDLLPSEVMQLRGHLNDAADDGDLGNWQLLAAVAALVDREIASAHYHFAWFESRNEVAR